jgi:hypothetical protein
MPTVNATFALSAPIANAGALATAQFRIVNPSTGVVVAGTTVNALAETTGPNGSPVFSWRGAVDTANDGFLVQLLIGGTVKASGLFLAALFGGGTGVGGGDVSFKVVENSLSQ